MGQLGLGKQLWVCSRVSR